MLLPESVAVALRLVLVSVDEVALRLLRFISLEAALPDVPLRFMSLDAALPDVPPDTAALPDVPLRFVSLDAALPEVPLRFMSLDELPALEPLVPLGAVPGWVLCAVLSGDELGAGALDCWAMATPAVAITAAAITVLTALFIGKNSM
jgi:hypothetical protein